MKIGIMSDCHLGVNKFRKMLNLQNMYCHLNNECFKEAFKIFKQKNVDSLIIAGDLFDNPNPNVNSIQIAKQEFDNFNKPIYLIGGNHDFSQKNLTINCHPFNLIENKYINSCINDFKIIEENDYEITLLPYKSMKPEFFKEIFTGRLKDKNKTSILVIHGYVDLNNDSESEEYALPKEVACNYDLVVCGHVHLNNVLKTNTTNILTPGALMPSNQAKESNKNSSIWIFDTNAKEIESIELKNSPKVKDIITSDINSIFEVISNSKETNNLYFIRYNGSMSSIDELLYKNAINNSLNISIQTNEQLDLKQIEKVSDFWKFVKEEYPEYESEFKEILKEE